VIDIVKKAVSHANRGKRLEDILNRTNDTYAYLGLANIKKVPVPVHIYKRTGATFTGSFLKGEWVDYVGMVHGYSVIFDAKETALMNLPLTNIAEHQFDILDSWNDFGARSFLIVNFTKQERYFYLSTDELMNFKKRMDYGGRKSISLADFEEKGKELKIKDGYLDYLELL
jgi:recombination protein U